MTGMAMALFGPVGCQVSQVKDQVGQDQGQELDKKSLLAYIFTDSVYIFHVV